MIEHDQNYRAWFEKYRPRTLEEIVLPNEEVKSTLQTYYNNEFVRGNILSYGPPGYGKAQPNSEKILTPSGWTTMGNIRPGHYVVSKNGYPTKVINIYPQGKRKIYKVYFSDGTSVKCDYEHIWYIWKNRDNTSKTYRTMTTKELLEYPYGLFSMENTKYGTIQKKYRFSVPLCEPVIFQTNHSPLIDPYIMGLLLGDGSFKGMKKSGDRIRFSDKYSKNIDLLLKILRQTFDDIEIKNYDDTDYILISKKLANEIRRLGLDNKKSVDKFIPEEYLLLSDPLERQKLFEGIVQTDAWKCGDAKKEKCILTSYEFYTSSKQLMDNFIFLVESLGIYHNPARVNNTPRYTYKNETRVGRPTYSVMINMHKKRKNIINIEFCGEEEATCISVADPSKLYLTSNFTVTHNTTLSEVMIHKIIKDRNDIFILGRKTEDVDNLKRWLMQKATKSNQKIVKIEEMDRLSTQAQIVLKDGLMEKFQHNTAFLATTNSPEKIDPALITRFNLKINFSNLPIDGLYKRLEMILQAEGIEYTPENLNEFVQHYHQRGLRDLINNLELASTTGVFNPKTIESFSGVSESENYIIQYVVYLVKYAESLPTDKLKELVKNAKADQQFFTYYDYIMKIFKSELRLNYHMIYKELSESDLDMSAKNIINNYWQDLELKRFKATHTISLIHDLILNILEQRNES